MTIETIKRFLPAFTSEEIDDWYRRKVLQAIFAKEEAEDREPFDVINIILSYLDLEQ